MTVRRRTVQLLRMLSMMPTRRGRGADGQRDAHGRRVALDDLGTDTSGAPAARGGAGRKGPHVCGPLSAHRPCTGYDTDALEPSLLLMPICKFLVTHLAFISAAYN